MFLSFRFLGPVITLHLFFSAPFCVGDFNFFYSNLTGGYCRHPRYRFCLRWRDSVAVKGYKLRKMCDLLAHGKIHIVGSGPFVFFCIFLPSVLTLLNLSMRRFFFVILHKFSIRPLFISCRRIMGELSGAVVTPAPLAATGRLLGSSTWRSVGCSTWRAIAHIESTDFWKGVLGAILGWVCWFS